MPQYTENDINQALEAIARGTSVKKAAFEWGIPRSTLKNRMNGQQARDIAFSDLQRLSATQESYLAEWVRIQAALGLPPTHQQLKDFAERILQIHGVRGWPLGLFNVEVPSIDYSKLKRRRTLQEWVPSFGDTWSG
ncbi:hypothetical protein CKAH01_01805 [Colletotrichum kahawae]|uniref:HTH psq-type domain-containing protein n=1 Tax=Colletotrichum kahawae TaxID=34407 RepID=A0AAD9Y2J5_COLKA|nr:hypothetical protein CKAH01_01805 [Colletotrichum kahawae]